MNSSFDSARKFLVDQIQLEKVELDKISGHFYESRNLDSCDIFRFSLYDTGHVGSSQYVAVPKDSSTPFYLGELGE